MQITIKTLTPLWTGGADKKCDRIHETGIIGSLRWWYEAIVRGFGGYACDPTSSGNDVPKKCELNEQKFRRDLTSGKSVQEILDNQLCPACQLFGCTGWGRKFKLGISRDGSFRHGFEGILELRFLELKKISEKDRRLLKQTFKIIEEYGSIGGRTTRKPQKNKRVGSDYGLIKIESMDITSIASLEEVRNWLQKSKIKENYIEWPNLRYFFFVKNKFLWRKQINELIGLSDDGRKIIGNEQYQIFLRGEGGRNRKSKRIFSFQTGRGRIWGYAKDNLILQEIEDRLKDLLNLSSIIKGSEVVK